VAHAAAFMAAHGAPVQEVITDNALACIRSAVMWTLRASLRVNAGVLHWKGDTDACCNGQVIRGGFLGGAS
jgi:hypothetical protein